MNLPTKNQTMSAFMPHDGGDEHSTELQQSHLNITTPTAKRFRPQPKNQTDPRLPTEYRASAAQFYLPRYHHAIPKPSRNAATQLIQQPESAKANMRDGKSPIAHLWLLWPKTRRTQMLLVA